MDINLITFLGENMKKKSIFFAVSIFDNIMSKY